MAKHYWLMKTEPNEFSFEDLQRDGWTRWDGVRNYQAQNNMKAMRQGDLVLIYHSVGPKDVVGIATVKTEQYPDPTNDPKNPKDKWILVDIAPVKPLKTPVNLATIKADPALANIALIKQSRLSVMPLTSAEYNRILALGGL